MTWCTDDWRHYWEQRRPDEAQAEAKRRKGAAHPPDEAPAIARQSAIAELCEGLEGFVVSLTGSLRNRETMLTINHDELVRHIARARALLSKHSPDAPGSAGTRATESGDGDEA
jgi:hypothetical protein